MVNVEITIKGEIKNFEMPTNWDDINVGTFQNIYEIQTTATSELRLLVSIISELVGIEESVIKKFNAVEFNLFKDHLSFLFDMDSLSNLEPKDKIVCGDRTFYPTPIGDNISVEVMMMMEGVLAKSSDLMSDLASLLKVILREKDENGEWIDYDDVKPFDYNQIKISDIYSSIVGFSSGEKV